MIVGLTGFKHSGKDTVAAYLIKKHGYERRAFADPLKKSVAALFDILFSEVDKFKNDPNRIVAIGLLSDSAVPGKLVPTEMKSVTFREFLQRYGTEAHRDVPEMGEDFWVDLTLPHNGYYTDRNLVISDVRFDNEAAAIRGKGGKIVEVNRRGLDNQDLHRSESGLSSDVDYTIFNNGSLDDLEVSIEIMLERLNGDNG